MTLWLYIPSTFYNMLFFYFVLYLSTFDTILSKFPINTAFQDKVLNFYTLQPYIFENEKILSLILQNRLIKDKTNRLTNRNKS